MNAVVIGAGVSGLAAAYFLAKGGCGVKVYEAKKKEDLGYDWRDNVEPSVFEELGIPMPKTVYLCENVSMYGPDSDKPLRVAKDRETLDRNLDRKELHEILLGLAEDAGAEIHFETKVTDLIVKSGAVKGVMVGGSGVFCDLVVDCSGLFSPFRQTAPQLPGAEDEPKENEYFVAYRAYHALRDGCEAPEEDKRRIYLKHMGQNGLSWCVCEPDGVADVLIGRCGGLDEETLEEAKARLLADNPFVGDTVVRGGGIYKIPVRAPHRSLVCDGYALLGDSAYMTIPLRGSGIAYSLRAAKMLADTVVEKGNANLTSLWKYQVEYYRSIGASQFTVNALKNFILQSDPDKLRDTFECGLVTSEDIAAVMSEGGYKPGADVFKKLALAARRLPFLSELLAAALSGAKQARIAKRIPDNCNVAEVMAWREKLSGVTE